VTTISPIGVLLVDDQQATLWGLGQLIEGEWPHMSVAGKACDRDTALRLAVTAKPDVILLDLDLDGESSLDLLPELFAVCQAQVLVCTCLRDRYLHEQALRDGACGVVLKDGPAALLLEAITMAYQRRSASTAKLL
jgi:two-component system, NarL family, nitrate/nitrite response regulator NarL